MKELMLKRKGAGILQTQFKIRAKKNLSGKSRKPGQNDRGSLTVEAALILPLFLFAALALLSVMDMLTRFMDTELKLYQTARAAAVYGYGASDYISGREGDWIRLKVVYPLKSRGNRFSRLLLVENHVNVHIFNGYGTQALTPGEEREEYVYITTAEEVYHRRRSCPHLNVSVRAVSGRTVGSRRNEDGSRFHLCRYCGRGYSPQQAVEGQVYVTDYGGLYHTRINCPDLKRTIRVIPLSEAAGRRPCRDCG